jgi:anti-sigma regulatory factor (Ser/Thr protein kinase)
MSSDRSFGTDSETFTVDDLPRVRGLVARAGRRVGLASPQADDLVAAVNEVAINAVLYAGGKGSITVAQTPEGVAVEISDEGPGLPPDMSAGEPPAPNATGGRGLWLARYWCRRLTLCSSHRGLTVRMFMPIGIAAA